MGSLRSLPFVLTGTALLAGCEGPQAPTQAGPPVEAHVAAARSAKGPVIASNHLSYTDLTGATARSVQGTLHLSVETAGPVPRFPDAFIGSVAVFGYGWVDGDTGDGVVAVIHPLIGRDSHQNPDGWHTHPVTLAAGNAFDFCLAGIGTSQGGLSIVGNGLRLRMALRQAGVAADDLDVAAAFIVAVDAGCAGLGLGVDVLDAQGL